MPNHVHLILAPGDSGGLALALSRAHRLYAGFVSARARQTGHLFQGRFGSVAMDEDHLMAAARYVALNPVRGAVGRARGRVAPFERRRASGRPRRRARRGAAAPRPGAEFRRSSDLLDTDPDDPGFAALRRNELIGRPLGDPAFQGAISRRLGRAVTPGKRGPKPKHRRDGG